MAAVLITELTVYPVKSTRGRSVPHVDVHRWGLADDRRWMLIDADDTVVTGRQHPRLLLVSATPLGDGWLRLEGPHATPVEVDGRTTATMPVSVRIWRNDVIAAHPTSPADAWFSKLIGRDVRLVWLDDPTRRPVNPTYSHDGDHVSFADGYPVLLTTTASLRQLNDWIADAAVERGEDLPAALAMRRFRPNVVIGSDTPFVEDSWTRVRLGNVWFRVAKQCDRCVMTTLDPNTGTKGKEPIRTLSRHRRWDGKVWFGTNLIPDGTGVLRVGDPVAVEPAAR